MSDFRHFFSRLFCLEGKLLLRCIPSFFLLFLLFLFLILVSSGIVSSQQKEADSRIRIGIVLPEDSGNDKLYLSLFTAAANFPHTLEFPLMTQKEAEAQIRSGSCTAAVLFPENYRNGLLYGDELSLRILTSASAGTKQMLFSDLADAGVSLLVNLEAGCYAAHSVSKAYGYGIAVTDNGSEIAEFYVKALLRRLSLFEEMTLSDTGSLSLSAFVVRTILVLLLFLSAVCYCPLFDWQNPAFQKKLRILRFSPFCELLIPLVLILLSSLLLSALFLGSVILFSQFDNSFSGQLPELFFTGSAIFGLFSALFNCSALFVFLCQLVQNRLILSFVQFFGSILLLFLSGAFVPAAYLPQLLSRISSVLPAVPILHALTGLFTGVTGFPAILCCLLSGLLFYCASVALLHHRFFSERS